MRIRRKPLPFPPLITSPFSVSKPSPSTQPISHPKTDHATREETTKSHALVKKEQVLHPNIIGLLPINPSRLGTNSAKRDLKDLHLSPSSSCAPIEVLKKEEEDEEKGTVESTRNSGAQVNIIKRRVTGSPKEGTEKQEDESEKAKQEKKSRRSSGSAVLMEGSRCSRVNGRGWRCCQPTLVGYSLCEHHLGKGRMRSMNNAAVQGQLGCTEHKRKNSDEALGEKINGRRKRNRVPTVKARSISSLLDEINDHDHDHDDDDDDDEDYELIGSYLRNEPSPSE